MNLRLVCSMIALVALTSCAPDLAAAQGTSTAVGSSKAGASSLPGTITASLGIATERYSYDTSAEYSQSHLKVNQIQSRCVAIDRGGSPVRIANLSKIDADDILVYKVDYPGYKLTSIAKVKSGWYRSIIEETFEAKWLIRYEYTEPGVEPIPVSYSVFAYSPGTKRYDSLLGKWTVKEVLEGGHLRCLDDKGKSIVRDISDIEIGSGRM